MSTELQLTNCHYTEQDVGSKIKSSKKKFSWTFTMNELTHTVELFSSKMSQKKKVMCDNKLVFPTTV